LALEFVVGQLLSYLLRLHFCLAVVAVLVALLLYLDQFVIDLKLYQHYKIILNYFLLLQIGELH